MQKLAGITFIATILTLSTCAATEELRIHQLLPKSFLTLAIEPELPDDFISVNPDGKWDIQEWTYWGPRDVLEQYFNDPDTLSCAIIRVKNGNYTQMQIATPCEDEFEEPLRELGFRNFQGQRIRWGDYPVYTIQADNEHQTLLLAWAGVNNSDWTIKFQLLYPSSRSVPNAEDLKVWDHFLYKTRQLDSPELFMAHGHELHEGFTLVDSLGIQFKLIAEKRASDNRLQITMIPRDKRSEFHYCFSEVFTTTMTRDWHRGEALVFVGGSITSKELDMDLNTYVLLKTVEEFTNIEQVEGIVVYSKL